MQQVLDEPNGGTSVDPSTPDEAPPQYSPSMRRRHTSVPSTPPPILPSMERRKTSVPSALIPSILLSSILVPNAFTPPPPQYSPSMRRSQTLPGLNQHSPTTGTRQNSVPSESVPNSLNQYSGRQRSVTSTSTQYSPPQDRRETSVPCETVPSASPHSPSMEQLPTSDNGNCSTTSQSSAAGGLLTPEPSAPPYSPSMELLPTSDEHDPSPQALGIPERLQAPVPSAPPYSPSMDRRPTSVYRLDSSENPESHSPPQSQYSVFLGRNQTVRSQSSTPADRYLTSVLTRANSTVGQNRSASNARQHPGERSETRGGEPSTSPDTVSVYYLRRNYTYDSYV